MLKKLINVLTNKKLTQPRELSPFFLEGFHGDKYLQNSVFKAAQEMEVFIETGTNVGSTLHYFAKNNPDIACYSCEPHKESFDFARKKTKNLRNVEISNMGSMDFLHDIGRASIFDKKVLFWLDAHGHGFEWPLKEEIAFITKNFKNAAIFIDDFKVPHNENFLWDSYDGQYCSFDYIKDSIVNDSYSLYYPDYNIKTSEHHPLKGWAVIFLGPDLFNGLGQELSITKAQ